MSPKLALRRVIVQPEFVLIDGDTVTDVEHPPIAIPAAEWPTYSSERFPAEVAAWQAEIEAAGARDGSGPRADAASSASTVEDTAAQAGDSRSE